MDKRDYYSRILEDIRGLKACGLSGDEEQTILSFEKEIVFLSYTARTEEPMEEKSDDSRPDKRAMSDMASCEQDSGGIEENSVESMKPMQVRYRQENDKIDEISDENDNAGKEKEAYLDNNPDNLTNNQSLNINITPIEPETAKDNINTIMPAVSFKSSAPDNPAEAEDTTDIPREAPNPPILESDINDVDKYAGIESEPTEEADSELVEETVYEPESTITEETENDETVPIVINTPDIQIVDTADLFKEEYEKPLTDFVFDRSIVSLTSPANEVREKIDQRMIVTAFPLHPVSDDANTKIFCIVEYEKEFYTSSSYENADGSSIVQMKIDGFELMIMGKWNNYKFQSRVMASGLTAADGITVTVLDDIANNPNKTAIRNGHIKFSYDAAKDIKGIIEVFPVSDIENKTHLFYMRRAAEFNDYNEIGQSAVTISTLDGDRVLDVSVHNRELIAKMVPMSF